MSVTVTLRLLPDNYAINRLAAPAAIPSWADGPGFVSIGRTDEELSILCPENRVPEDSFGLRSDRGWRCLQFVGPFPFDQTGIAAAVLEPLARAEIGILIISTFDTDYLLVKAEKLERATAVLIEAGHGIAA